MCPLLLWLGLIGKGKEAGVELEVTDSANPSSFNSNHVFVLGNLLNMNKN